MLLLLDVVLVTEWTLGDAFAALYPDVIKTALMNDEESGEVLSRSTVVRHFHGLIAYVILH